MKNVTFISAGAGSGKTHKLLECIVELVENKKCYADEIILTTFTRVAAAELQEKARAALYKRKCYVEAEKLDNAAIGTIHSIAYQMVSRYWFLLGLSADLRMIADEDRYFYISQSLASLPDDKDIELFQKLKTQFGIEKKDAYNRNVPDFNFWQPELRAIIDKVNDFCLDDAAIEKSKEDSKKLLAEILKVNQSGSSPVSVKEVLDHAKKVADATLHLRRGNPAAKQQKVNDVIDVFEKAVKKREPRLVDYIKISDGIVGLLTNELTGLCEESASFFMGLRERIMSDPATYDLICTYIDTIFALAGKWMNQYQEFKNERRLLDFNDVQMYFSKLLDMPEVTEEINSRYKVVLVDEFQDCSPQQIALFTKLSRMMERSIWVGDIKQAIYNFRGTDTSLVKDVIDTVTCKKDGNDIDWLKECWRSGQDIIDLANNVFIPTFSNTLHRDLVYLQSPADRKGNPAPVNRGLKHWHISIEKADFRYDSIASQIKKLKNGEGFEYSDIALLCRRNSEIAKYAEAFKRLRIPYQIYSDVTGSEENPVVNFLISLVSVVAYPGNNFSKALVAYYSEEGYTASHTISERLRQLSDPDSGEWLDHIELIKQLKEIGKVLGNQSIASAVETLLIELNIADKIKTISKDVDAYDVCRRFINAAATYEERCLNLGLGCSLMGFIDSISSDGLPQNGDEKGVTLATYHKSKGLEWKCVVLSSLNEELINIDYVFFGVQVLRNGRFSQISLTPRFLLKYLTASIIQRIEESATFAQLVDDTKEEAKRLLYVGMTRPKELLVTSTAETNRKVYGTDWIDHVTGVSMNATECNAAYLEWMGSKFSYVSIEYVPVESEDTEDSWIVDVLKGTTKPTDFILRDLYPSQLPPLENVKGAEVVDSFAERLNAKATNGDDAVLGDCIHQLLCVYEDTSDFKEMIPKVAGEYEVAIVAESFMDSAAGMYEWLKNTYGEPIEILRETPFRFMTDKGQEVHGEIDLIYRTKDGDVLIDYKTFPGKITEVTNPNSNSFAGKYSGQLNLYEDAIKRAGYNLRDSLICYFTLGKMIRLTT